MYCKIFISVDTKEFLYPFSPSQICTQQNYLWALLLLLLFKTRGFARGICFSRSEKGGMGSCHVSCTEETKIKTELYNHYLHHFTMAAKLRHCFYFFILLNRAGMKLDSLFYLPFFCLHLLDQI